MKRQLCLCWEKGVRFQETSLTDQSQSWSATSLRHPKRILLLSQQRPGIPRQSAAQRPVITVPRSSIFGSLSKPSRISQIAYPWPLAQMCLSPLDFSSSGSRASGEGPGARIASATDRTSSQSWCVASLRKGRHTTSEGVFVTSGAML